MRHNNTSKTGGRQTTLEQQNQTQKENAKGSLRDMGPLQKRVVRDFRQPTTDDFEYHLDALDKKIVEREYSLDEVRGLFTYRPMSGEGYTIGHKICRRRFVSLAARMKAQHGSICDEWMNATIGDGVAPANYTPFMCLMSQKFNWKKATVSDQRAIIYAIMRPMGKTKKTKKQRRNTRKNTNTQNIKTNLEADEFRRDCH